MSQTNPWVHPVCCPIGIERYVLGYMAAVVTLSAICWSTRNFFSVQQMAIRWRSFRRHRKTLMYRFLNLQAIFTRKLGPVPSEREKFASMASFDIRIVEM